MGLKFSNFGKAVIASAPSGTTGLSFTVEAGKGLYFPSLGVGDYFYGILKDASGNTEIVKVSARSTDAMTIATGGRGLDDTTARTWAAGDYFVAGLTNIALQESLGSAILAALSGLAGGANKVPYFTGASAMALADLTAFARTLLDDADAATIFTTLGISAFIQTLLNDVDAATARATIGAVGLTGNETIAGTKTLTSNLLMSGAALCPTGASVAAHATTSNIWNANYINYTGTALTITAFAAAPQAGCEVELYLNAAHTFVHGANMILPGATNYTAEVGDRIRVRAGTTTQFVIQIIRQTPFASGAEMSTGTSLTKLVSPGNFRDHKSAAKAWVLFNGTTGAVTNSYNVSSVSRTGVGIYTINFVVPISNYAPAGHAQDDGGGNSTIVSSQPGDTRTTTACMVRTYLDIGTAADSLLIGVHFFGD